MKESSFIWEACGLLAQETWAIGTQSQVFPYQLTQTTPACEQKGASDGGLGKEVLVNDPSQWKRRGCSGSLSPTGPQLPESLPNECSFIWGSRGLCQATKPGQQDPSPGAFTGRWVPKITSTWE